VPDEALINRMGFNNPGAEAMASTLAEWRALGFWPKHPVGINLGKSKIAPLEKAGADYAASLCTLWPYADFFVVNVSSPNTPNLRRLQDKAALDDVLATLQDVQKSKAASAPSPVPKPILVKVAPDLSFEALNQILELAAPRQIAGLVATNTTIGRPESAASECQRTYAEAGGLSGRPLRARSTEVIRHIYRQTRGALPIIGVGGIFNADDAWEKVRAGASLLQIYTGLVYEGPGVVSEIVSGLSNRLRSEGFAILREAVGTE
jgi:dihydroorotate dehydrogenase